MVLYEFIGKMAETESLLSTCCICIWCNNSSRTTSCSCRFRDNCILESGKMKTLFDKTWRNSHWFSVYTSITTTYYIFHFALYLISSSSSKYRIDSKDRVKLCRRGDYKFWIYRLIKIYLHNYIFTIYQVELHEGWRELYTSKPDLKLSRSVACATASGR